MQPNLRFPKRAVRRRPDDRHAPARQRVQAQSLVLLYSNRRPEDAAFLAELQALEGRNKNFRLLATMTEPGKSARPWTGATGRIDDALLKRIGGELATPIYYLAGPPALVEAMRCDAMRKNLNLAGVDDDDIRSEEFYGY